MRRIFAVLTLAMMLLSVSCRRNTTEDISSIYGAGEIKNENSSSAEILQPDEMQSDSQNLPIIPSSPETPNEITQQPSTPDTSSQDEQTKPDDEHIHNFTTEVIEPNCKFVGYSIRRCDCGTQEKYAYVNALGHDWGRWEEIKKPTADNEGLKRRICSRCSEQEDQKVEKLPTQIGDFMIEVLRLTNIEREKQGLAPLEYYSVAQSAADIRAQEIRKEFSHTRPDGSDCFTVLDDINVEYFTAGENISYGYSTPQDAVTAWMDSQSHRENILSSDFTHLVVGYNADGSSPFWVQIFLGL